MVEFLRNRLKERSTWVGFSMLAAALGYHIDPDLFQALLAILGLTHAALPD
jgi:hypothetical protein